VKPIDLEALEARAVQIASGAPYSTSRILDRPRHLEYAIVASDGDMLARTMELIGTGDGISAKVAAEFYASAPVDVLALIARVRTQNAEIEACAMLAAGNHDAIASVESVCTFAVNSVRQLRAAFDAARESSERRAASLLVISAEMACVREENERLRLALTLIADNAVGKAVAMVARHALEGTEPKP